MSDNQEKIQTVFNRANINRNNIQFKLSRTLFDHVSFMENKIRKQLKTFTLLSICGGERSNFIVNSFFENAFSALTIEEKVLFFQKTINYLLKFEKEKQSNNVTTEEKQLERIKNKYGSEVRVAIQINSGFRSWDQETITISGYKINSMKKINIDLRNYLLRKSKKKQVDCHVLEALRTSKPPTVRFCFKTKQEETKYFSLINDLINAAYYDFVCKESFNTEIGIMKKSSKNGRTKIALQEPHILMGKKNRQTVEPNIQNQQNNLGNNLFNAKHQVSVSYQLMKSKDQQQIQEDLKDIIEQQNKKIPIGYQTSSSMTKSERKIKTEKKNFLNVFSIMLPTYNLNDLDSLIYFEPVHEENDRSLLIYRNKSNRCKFKMELVLPIPPEKVLMILQNVEMYKNWNPSVTQGQQKFRIQSENCSIFYQKHAKFSQWYRERDYLYLKHVFSLKNSFYLVDKSFQNTNFVPFASIERGNIKYCVTRVSQSSKGCNVTMQIEMNQGGLLKQSYQEELTLDYLKGFKNIKHYFSKSEVLSKLQNYFYHNWAIDETFSNESQLVSVENLRTQDFQNSEINSKQIDDSELYFSVDDYDRQGLQDQVSSQHEIQEKQIIEHEEHLKESRSHPSKIQLNEEGRVIIPQNYIKKKHIVQPASSCPNQRVQMKFDHILLQDNWKHMPTGGLQIINQKKIQAQNNVFSFILKKLKQNIFSGKGLTNISLPVQIFNCDSNLSRICRCFALAPEFLQRAAKSKDPVERFKLTIVFGISTSLFFLDAEKPFNPILGETYQGTIDGCPIYGEQISHHPPISSFYMIGRGYKIFGGIEAKVNLHINSADGLNEGFYNIQFDDGQKITFTGPAGQVSNTTMGGNRQFNYLGKGVYFDAKNRLYSQLKFQEETGMFSKSKWKYRDQVEAEIWKVKESFFNEVESKIKEKKSPSSKEIDQKYSKLSGRWLFEVLWDSKVYYKTNENIPFQMKNYEYPLPSDAFYREDIYYRIMEDLSRSQHEKERLQVLQRGDRKFREKYHGPAH